MMNPSTMNETNRPVGTARALLGARGGVLSARGAQQEQQAARNEGRRERADGGEWKSAHECKVAHFASVRKRGGVRWRSSAIGPIECAVA
jgi:hypothetical protein